MTAIPHNLNRRDDLRSRAVVHLNGPDARAHAGASAAFGVLYELASSPSTAPDALALLHELQVHQVEVDLQDEELRHARVEFNSTITPRLAI